jgi:hypothetical protein
VNKTERKLIQLAGIKEDLKTIVDATKGIAKTTKHALTMQKDDTMRSYHIKLVGFHSKLKQIFEKIDEPEQMLYHRRKGLQHIKQAEMYAQKMLDEYNKFYNENKTFGMNNE